MPFSRVYLIDRLIPANELSFVFGSPGAGKSTFLCHLASQLLTSSHFSFSNHNLKIAPNLVVGYAAFDRSSTSMFDLLRKYQLDTRIKWRSYRNVKNPDASDQRRVRDIPLDFPGCNVLIIDGLGLTIPTGKSNDYCTVGNYVRYCGTVAEEFGITILAVLHSPKPRIGEGIANPRMGALGSTAFPGIAETMIQVEHVDMTNPKDPNRLIRIMPHDGPALESTWQFDASGRLIECQDPIVEADDNDLKGTMLGLMPVEFPSNDAVKAADQLGVTRRTAYNYLKELVDAGKIIQIRYGWYRKVSEF